MSSGLKRIQKGHHMQGDTNSSSALDVVFFVREIMETNPKLRPTILARLLDTFSQICSSRVCSCALWILSEYCITPQDIDAALEVSPACIQPMQIAAQDSCLC